MEPNPIPFASAEVPTLIANDAYDERTSIENAMLFRTSYTNSKLITAQAGGHMITPQNSPECFALMMNFILNDVQPNDGHLCHQAGRIDFIQGLETWDASVLKVYMELAPCTLRNDCV